LHIKTIKEIPLNDRPREKMAANGAAVLTDAELIAILLRTGTAEKSAIDIARGVRSG
jgi:DNA repair protein RadC